MVRYIRRFHPPDLLVGKTILSPNFFIHPKNSTDYKIALVGNSQISIGKYTYGLENIALMQWGEGASLSVGKFCSIGASITIYLGGNHRIDWITTFPFGHIFHEEFGSLHISGHPKTNGDVVIGNDVWIGGNVTIMSGIKIGNGSVIAANAVVTKDVAPYAVVGGNPAKKIMDRFDAEIVASLQELRWWDLTESEIVRIAKDLSQKPTLELVSILRKNCGSYYRKESDEHMEDI